MPPGQKCTRHHRWRPPARALAGMLRAKKSKSGCLHPTYLFHAIAAATMLAWMKAAASVSSHALPCRPCRRCHQQRMHAQAITAPTWQPY